MLIDNYTSSIDEGFDVEVTSSSRMSDSIKKIEMCGVKLKDIQTIDKHIAFIPMNIREMNSKRNFLEKMGFTLHSEYMTRD